MPKALSKKKYAELIVAALGGTVVDIELENDIDKFLELAFLKVKPRIGTTKYMTKPLLSYYDFRNAGVYAVINVYRTNPVSLTSNVSTISDVLTDSFLFSGTANTYLNRALGITNTDNIAISLLTSQLINQASGRSSDIDFEFDDGQLFVETVGAGTSLITIEYIPDYQSVEDISEPFWITIIFDLALAYTKIALGRARGKYRLSNLPYETDADTILQEGTSELERINEKLEELNDINYFLD